MTSDEVRELAVRFALLAAYWLVVLPAAVGGLFLGVLRLQAPPGVFAVLNGYQKPFAVVAFIAALAVPYYVSQTGNGEAGEDASVDSIYGAPVSLIGRSVGFTRGSAPAPWPSKHREAHSGSLWLSWARKRRPGALG